MTEKMSRRDFGKTLFKTAAVSLAAGLPAEILFSEWLDAARNDKIETSEGMFYPMLEEHSVGINNANLPKKFSAYFRECVYYTDPPKNPGDTVLNQTYTIPASDLVNQFLREEDLEAISERGAILVFGDLLLPDVYAAPVSSKGVVAGGAGVVAATAGGVIEVRSESAKRLSRRRFLAKSLEYLGAGSAAVLSAPMLFSDISGVLYKYPRAPQPLESLRRGVARMHTTAEKILPDDFLVTYRSLYFAKILLEVNKYLKNNRLPQDTVFRTGADHEVVGEYLQMGEGYINNRLLSFKISDLQKILAVNPDWEHTFAAGRLVRLFPKNNGNLWSVTDAGIVSDPGFILDLKTKLKTV